MQAVHASELRDVQILLQKAKDQLNSKDQQHQIHMTELKSKYEREMDDQAKKSKEHKHQTDMEKLKSKAKARELLKERDAQIKLQKKLQQYLEISVFLTSF